eukprot:CAMPEP_0194203862 /NCGR_PEP_ID=MMETSP0156-20130528/3521_1 /TAXON_ID=33649 /ORGANISM="Thalassionema nitzschioides, Strain L26-B" /LENGTH=425 /DNA_ID=CAMNT_0038929709 /DNA_START=148 /DNA_END=1422 /DNA_ORIENTATION=+
MAEVRKLKAEIKSLKKELEDLSKLADQGGRGYDASATGGICSGLISKVNHFAIIIADAERSKEFYVDILGARILNRPNFPSPGYWLWLGNIQLHIIENKKAALSEATHAKGIATGHVNHLSLEVHNFDAVEAALKEANVEYTKNLVPEGGSVIHQLFVPDPDGHYVEICDCNRFNDFVFAEELDVAESQRLASVYLEGADMLGATVAAAASLIFLPGENADSQEDFNGKMGNISRIFRMIAGEDGEIEVNDWYKFLKRMGHQATEEEVADMLKSADSDGDGVLDFKEFSAIMLAHMKNNHISNEDQMRNAFSVMDRNDDGSVDKEELLLMLWGMGVRMDETQLANAIVRADKDGDGKIDVDEFVELSKEILNLSSTNGGSGETAAAITSDDTSNSTASDAIPTPEVVNRHTVTNDTGDKKHKELW